MCPLQDSKLPRHLCGHCCHRPLTVISGKLQGARLALAEAKRSMSTSSPCPGAKTKGVTRPLPPAGASSHPFPALRFHRERQDQAGTVLGLGWKVDIEHRPSQPKMESHKGRTTKHSHRLKKHHPSSRHDILTMLPPGETREAPGLGPLPREPSPQVCLLVPSLLETRIKFSHHNNQAPERR